MSLEFSSIVRETTIQPLLSRSFSGLFSSYSFRIHTMENIYLLPANPPKAYRTILVCFILYYKIQAWGYKSTTSCIMLVKAFYSFLIPSLLFFDLLLFRLLKLHLGSIRNSDYTICFPRANVLGSKRSNCCICYHKDSAALLGILLVSKSNISMSVAALVIKAIQSVEHNTLIHYIQE